MSKLDSFLAPESVIIDTPARCKREALTILAQHSADRLNVSADEVLATLLEREKLGSTGVGGGIAIPHGKLEGIKSIFGAIMRLPEPVDFEALDEKPVDLIFLMLVPVEDDASHLKMLSRIARLMRNEEVRSAMRGANSVDALYAIAIDQEKSRAA